MIPVVWTSLSRGFCCCVSMSVESELIFQLLLFSCVTQALDFPGKVVGWDGVRSCSTISCEAKSKNVVTMRTHGRSRRVSRRRYEMPGAFLHMVLSVVFQVCCSPSPDWLCLSGCGTEGQSISPGHRGAWTPAEALHAFLSVSAGLVFCCFLWCVVCFLCLFGLVSCVSYPMAS